jgi:hypothetical protein
MPLAPAWYMVAFIFHSSEPEWTPVRAEVIRSPSGSDFWTAESASVRLERGGNGEWEMTAVAKNPASVRRIEGNLLSAYLSGGVWILGSRTVTTPRVDTSRRDSLVERKSGRDFRG